MFLAGRDLLMSGGLDVMFCGIFVHGSNNYRLHNQSSRQGGEASSAVVGKR
jgi:hypothetical protein